MWQPFTEEHQHFRKLARDFAEKELAPHAEAWAAEGCFPNSGFKRAGARGIQRAVRDPTWDNRMEIRAKSVELDGGVMGIIGLGGTGIEAAKRAVGFGMSVIAIESEDIAKPDFVDQVWKHDRLHDLLERADVVIICAPLTEQTRGMFGRTEFQRMKPTAFIINVTRGQIVDEDALLEALDKGLIAGAGLDVTPEEPLPPESPLWRMDNVIVTPHASGGSPRRDDRSVALFCENLKRFLNDEPLLSVIDKRKGY